MMSDPLAQLRWRCRRGMKELDVLLIRYLDQRYPHAPETERAAFAFLLQQSDMDLMAWLIKGQPAAGALTLLVKEILKCEPIN